MNRMLRVSVRFSMQMVLKLRTITASVFLTPSATVAITMTTGLVCTSSRQDTTIPKLVVLF